MIDEDYVIDEVILTLLSLFIKFANFLLSQFDEND